MSLSIYTALAQNRFCTMKNIFLRKTHIPQDFFYTIPSILNKRRRNRNPYQNRIKRQPHQKKRDYPLYNRKETKPSRTDQYPWNTDRAACIHQEQTIYPYLSHP